MSDTQQEQYVKTHPGKVWKHRTEILVTVPLPPTNEEKQVTRERLAEGVRCCFRGDPERLKGYVEQCFLRPLLIVELDLLDREYGVVLQP